MPCPDDPEVGEGYGVILIAGEQRVSSLSPLIRAKTIAEIIIDLAERVPIRCGAGR
jgi:hypothetical protein